MPMLLTAGRTVCSNFMIMKKKLAAALFFGLFGIVASRSEAANLLTNSFFDAKLSGWTIASGAFTATHDPTMGANAPGSLHVTTTAAVVNGGLTQCVAVSPSTAYDVLAHFRVQTGSALPSVRIQLQWFQDATCGAFIPGSPPTTNTPAIVLDTWQTTTVVGLVSPLECARRQRQHRREQRLRRRRAVLVRRRPARAVRNSPGHAPELWDRVARAGALDARRREAAPDRAGTSRAEDVTVPMDLVIA